MKSRATKLLGRVKVGVERIFARRSKGQDISSGEQAAQSRFEFRDLRRDPRKSHMVGAVKAWECHGETRLVAPAGPMPSISPSGDPDVRLEHDFKDKVSKTSSRLHSCKYPKPGPQKEEHVERSSSDKGRRARGGWAAAPGSGPRGSRVCPGSRSSGCGDEMWPAGCEFAPRGDDRPNEFRKRSPNARGLDGIVL